MVKEQHKTADLHLHTALSDGTFSPAEVVERAVSAGLAAIAVTDHDLVDGITEAKAVAAKRPLEIIPGIELSCHTGTEEIHLLGYFIRHTSAPLRNRLRALQRERIARLEGIVTQLNRVGIAITAQEIFELAGPGSVGRLHVARALLQRGAVHSIDEAFDRYLGTNKVAYLPASHLNPEEAIRLIREADGVPVLAHPAYLKDELQVIEMLQELGLAGLEVHHSSHSSSTVRRYEQLAEQRGLLKTGGSDCHGLAKGEVLIGSVQIPYAWVDDLKTWRNTHTSTITNAS